MMKELISIIIPTYNRADLLQETLDSILKQTYPYWECLFVDDGSTDSSESLIKEYIKKDSRFYFYNRPANLSKGANSCRNFGYSKSRGSYIQWFDSDDIMLESFLEEKIYLFEDAIQLVICTGYYVNEKLENKRLIKLQNSFDLYKDYVMWRQHIMTPSILFRKSFLEDKELFSSTIFKSQEAEFFSRLFFEQPNSIFKVVNKPLFLYRRHASTISMQNEKYVEGYKESEAFVVAENLRRAIKIDDYEIMRSRYRLLISLALKAIKNKHKKNVDYILSIFKELLFKKNKASFQLIRVSFFIYFFINFPFFRIDYILKKLPIR